MVEKKLQFLNELSTRLQSLLESENVYQEIVNVIYQKFNHYSVQIWSASQDGKATLRAQAGAYGKHLRIGHILENQEGITGYVIRTKKSYISNNVANDPNFTNLSLPVISQAELCVPVVKDNEVIATLNLESDNESFDENDVMTLEAVASQISVAITNQKLYLNVKEFNSSLRSKVEEKTQELRKANDQILQQQKLLQKENKALKTLINQDNKSTGIIGQSPAMINILSMVDKIAPTPATVLLQGESGTGKELIARRLHFKSDRQNQPYVTVNCGALQESLLESELFGHEKGAFTGAVAQKLGLAESAEGGTLFLDEIGEMSLGIQAKLLRFLQEGEFYRIGGKKPIRVDIRIISATNRDLEQEVKAGRFREDLFYRLNTITLRMPPLRKRKEDIGLLVNHFLSAAGFGGSANQIKKVDPAVIQAFNKYDWPGNIRELQNTIERLKILAENNEIRIEDIPFNIRMPKARANSSDFTIDMSLDDVEKNHILRALAYHHGNKTKTAQSLGITIKTLYNKLHRYGILQKNTGGQARV